MTIIKAEWLLTRRCNQACAYCGIRRIRDEMTQSQMRYGIDALKELGCLFIAIYGGEPMLSPLLLPMLKYCKKVEMLNTVITNGSLWRTEDTPLLLGSGLGSVTVSMDSLSALPGDTKYDAQRRADAMRVMDDLEPYARDFHRLGKVLDREVSVTITPRNLDSIVELTEFWTSRGVWVSYDFVHVGSHPGTKRAKAYYPKWTQEADERAKVHAIAIAVKKIGKETGRVHTSDSVLKRWSKFYDNPIWHCSVPAWVSVDCDGSMLPCDDLEDERVADIKVWQLKDKWLTFHERWLKAIEKCPGCFWSAHIMSEEMVGSPEGRERFLHGRSAGKPTVSTVG